MVKRLSLWTNCQVGLLLLCFDGIQVSSNVDRGPLARKRDVGFIYHTDKMRNLQKQVTHHVHGGMIVVCMLLDSAVIMEAAGVRMQARAAVLDSMCGHAVVHAFACIRDSACRRQSWRWSSPSLRCPASKLQHSAGWRASVPAEHVSQAPAIGQVRPWLWEPQDEPHAAYVAAAQSSEPCGAVRGRRPQPVCHTACILDRLA